MNEVAQMQELIFKGEMSAGKNSELFSKERDSVRERERKREGEIGAKKK